MIIIIILNFIYIVGFERVIFCANDDDDDKEGKDSNNTNYYCSKLNGTYYIMNLVLHKGQDPILGHNKSAQQRRSIFLGHQDLPSSFGRKREK